MNLFIYTGASRLNAAVVESATDLTPVARLPDLIVGDSEPVTVKFLSASGAFESWSGGGTYTLSISIGTLGADGIGAYFQTSSFTAVTNGWTGRLNLASGSLPSAVAGYLADRPGAQSVPLFLQVRVTDADGNTETYARQAVAISGAVSVPTTANSTPVTYATAADVAADAATASAAAIASAASASAASGSASAAAGHVTTAGNSATAAAASAVTAGNSATTAAGSATTATTQATNAATSSSDASTYKDAAAVSAASATSSAGTATTQAALATTNGAAQVTLAAAQVTLATTQATNAGTSATAAGVSAAAALVSEAAALVSKNAAAASAATASAVSGSGNGTFSAAALTGVTSVTAPAATALTLAGGTSGASLVLGQGTSAAATLAMPGVGIFTVSNVNDAGFVNVGRFLSPSISGGNSALILIGKAAASNQSAFLNYVYSGTAASTRLDFGHNGTTGQVSLTQPGNLLIGTTTDMTGSGGLKVAGTTSATSSTAGAFLVGNGTAATNVAIGGGSMIAGANVQAIGNINIGVVGSDFSSGRLNIVAGSDTVPGLSFGGSNYGFGILEKTDGNLYFSRRTGSTTNTTWLSVGRDTGNVLFASSTASTNTTSGALVVTGGVGVGGAMNVGGAATFAGAVTAQGDVSVTRTGGAREVRITTTTSGVAGFYAQGYSSATTITGAAGGELVLYNQDATANAFGAVTNLDASGNTTSRIRFINESDANNTGSITFATRPSGGSLTDALTLASTGAATFAGAVTIPAATTARASMRIPHGTAPTSPVDGDMWTTTAGLYIRINGATVGPLS